MTALRHWHRPGVSTCRLVTRDRGCDPAGILALIAHESIRITLLNLAHLNVQHRADANFSGFPKCLKLLTYFNIFGINWLVRSDFMATVSNVSSHETRHSI